MHSRSFHTVESLGVLSALQTCWLSDGSAWLELLLHKIKSLHQGAQFYIKSFLSALCKITPLWDACVSLVDFELDWNKIQ